MYRGDTAPEYSTVKLPHKLQKGLRPSLIRYFSPMFYHAKNSEYIVRQYITKISTDLTGKFEENSLHNMTKI